MNNTVNPYFPKRKIRHAKLLISAGFSIDENWYRDRGNRTENPKPTSVTKLIYWKRGNITIAFFDDAKVELQELIERIIAQVFYNTKNRARVVFDG